VRRKLTFEVSEAASLRFFLVVVETSIAESVRLPFREFTVRCFRGARSLALRVPFGIVFGADGSPGVLFHWKRRCFFSSSPFIFALTFPTKRGWGGCFCQITHAPSAPLHFLTFLLPLDSAEVSSLRGTCRKLSFSSTTFIRTGLDFSPFRHLREFSSRFRSLHIPEIRLGNVQRPTFYFLRFF